MTVFFREIHFVFLFFIRCPAGGGCPERPDRRAPVPLVMWDRVLDHMEDNGNSPK
jgi:hypothetical protein